MSPAFRVLVVLAGFCLLVPPGRGAAPSVAAVEPVPNRLVLGGGVAGVFDSDRTMSVVVELRGGASYAGIHPWMGLGWATDGATFIGGGGFYTFGEDRPWQATIGFGPGYYDRHHGVELGTHLEFLSFVEVSRTVGRGHRVAVRLAHISNGSIVDHNPGIEALTVGYMIPLGR